MWAGSRRRGRVVEADWLQISPESSAANNVMAEVLDKGEVLEGRAMPLILVVVLVYCSYFMWGEKTN